VYNYPNNKAGIILMRIVLVIMIGVKGVSNCIAGKCPIPKRIDETIIANTINECLFFFVINCKMNTISFN